MLPYFSLCSAVKVTLTSEERVKMKALCGTGLKLIGFKSLELLKDFHQVTKSYFLYPDEKAIKGSVTAFSAFHSRMHASKKFALCCYATSRGSQPTLVALVAQQEGRDSDGLQVPQVPYLFYCSLQKEQYCSPLLVLI